jgi:hypothetical protein
MSREVVASSQQLRAPFVINANPTEALAQTVEF